MNSLLPSAPPPPHQLYNSKFTSRHYHYHAGIAINKWNEVPFSTPPSSRKRKADDDDLRTDVRMSSASPTSSPQIPSQTLPLARSIKRARSGAIGRPLTLARLLETLDTDALRSVLKNICDQNPAIATEVEKSAPRPSVASALDVLKSYETKLQEAFPFGGNSSSDYAFNRVRQPLMALLEALNDFTPHFLPPNETQVGLALAFLDGATDIIHRLPNWENFQNSLHKQNAYEEISRAWTLVLREAGKRAAGIQLQYDGWDKKLAKHNLEAGGKLATVIHELNNILGWQGGSTSQHHPQARDDINNVRQELLSGTYGANFPVRVGPW